MAKKTFTDQDYIKANRKASRDEEIIKHGKQISMRPTKVHNPKNDYKRSKMKKVDIFDEDFELGDKYNKSIYGIDKSEAIIRMEKDYDKLFY